jgi:hypothetical protein
MKEGVISNGTSKLVIRLNLTMLLLMVKLIKRLWRLQRMLMAPCYMLVLKLDKLVKVNHIIAIVGPAGTDITPC